MTERQRARLESAELKELIRRVDMEDLPESHRVIAEIVGKEDALRLCEMFGGSNRFVPGIEAADIPFRNRRILRGFLRGMTAQQLACAHGMTGSGVRGILRNMDGVDPSAPVAVSEFPGGIRKFAEVIGVEHALSLCRGLGGVCGGPYYFPSNKRLAARVREKAVYDGLSQGLGVRELAEEFRVTEATISNDIARMRDRQKKERLRR